MAKHNVSVGGIQSAQKKRVELDLIERQNEVWRVVVPVFAEWFRWF